VTPRLATSLYVNALVRCVNQAGGMAMVLAKGDETAGALVLITLENGVNTGVWERSMDRGRGLSLGPNTHTSH